MQDETELMIPESAVVDEYTVVKRDTHDGDTHTTISLMREHLSVN